MSVSCRDYTTELVCFNDGTNSRQLIAHYEYAKGSSNSILLATRYTEADGITVVDTTIGTVIPGECCKPIIQYFQKFYYDSTLDECTPIKETITTLCDGTQTYQYLMEDGMGNLVPANTIITNFSENNIKLKCNDPLPILEKEICGTIDGSTETYELVRVYTRNPITGVMTVVHYEDNFGNIITGAVVETCCTCDTLCSITPVPQPNQRCVGYSGNDDPNVSNSSWMIASRYNPLTWVGNCGSSPAAFTWELVSCIVNGTELITTPVVVTVPFSSMTLTLNGIATNYATAFNALPQLLNNDIVLDPDMVNYNWNTSKPFLLAFRQYTSDTVCTPNLTSRIEYIKGGQGDGFDFATSSNLVDLQSTAMTLYNTASIPYPFNATQSCVTI